MNYNLDELPKSLLDNEYEIAFCVKFNRKIFKDQKLLNHAKKSFEDVERKYRDKNGNLVIFIKTLIIFDSYVHMTVCCDPAFGIHNAINKFKRTSAKNLRAFDPSLDRRLPSIWTYQTYCKTIGSYSSQGTILDYVESQSGKKRK